MATHKVYFGSRPASPHLAVMLAVTVLAVAGGWSVEADAQAQPPAGRPAAAATTQVTEFPPDSDLAGQLALLRKTAASRAGMDTLTSTLGKTQALEAAQVESKAKLQPDDPDRRLAILRLQQLQDMADALNASDTLLGELGDAADRLEKVHQAVEAGTAKPADQQAAQTHARNLYNLFTQHMSQMAQAELGRLDEMTTLQDAAQAKADARFDALRQQLGPLAPDDRTKNDQDGQRPLMEAIQKSRAQLTQVNESRKVYQAAIQRTQDEGAAFNVVREAVKAGRQSQADLAAATASLKAVEDAQLDALKAEDAAWSKMDETNAQMAKLNEETRLQTLAQSRTTLVETKAQLAKLQAAPNADPEAIKQDKNFIAFEEGRLSIMETDPPRTAMPKLARIHTLPALPVLPPPSPIAPNRVWAYLGNPG